MNEEILDFIGHFTNNGKYKEVIETFTCGNCFWFAWILNKRFSESTLMYNTIENHFGAKIDGRLYDITGEITNQDGWMSWDDFAEQDGLLTQRIYRDCINFTKQEG